MKELRKTPRRQRKGNSVPGDLNLLSDGELGVAPALGVGPDRPPEFGYSFAGFPLGFRVAVEILECGQDALNEKCCFDQIPPSSYFPE